MSKSTNNAEFDAAVRLVMEFFFDNEIDVSARTAAELRAVCEEAVSIVDGVTVVELEKYFS